MIINIKRLKQNSGKLSNLYVFIDNRYYATLDSKEFAEAEIIIDGTFNMIEIKEGFHRSIGVYYNMKQRKDDERLNLICYDRLKGYRIFFAFIYMFLFLSYPLSQIIIEEA